MVRTDLEDEEDAEVAMCAEEEGEGMGGEPSAAAALKSASLVRLVREDSRRRSCVGESAGEHRA